MYGKNTLNFVFFMTAVAILAGCGIQLQIKPLNGELISEPDDPLDPDEYWDMIVETVQSPGPLPAGVQPLFHWFDNGYSPKGFSYVYGGKTACRIQPGTAIPHKEILAVYLDDADYSGVTITRGDGASKDLRQLRAARVAGLGFWCKGSVGGEKVYVGLLDDDAEGKKVQTKVALRDFGNIDTMWHYFMIPLRRFQPKGKYWDEQQKSEVLSDVKWQEINEIRFSVNRGENRVSEGNPVCIYVADVACISEIPGYVDPDEYWNSFVSDTPDMLLHDFETDADSAWTTGSGPASVVSIKRDKATDGRSGSCLLAVSYRLNDWCDVMYDYRIDENSRDKRDWTHHWGIRLTVCSNKAYQALNLQISDAGNELYIASCGVPGGCTDIIVPFRDFEKFPYYQPPDARHDGRFDLDGVMMLDLKPSGEGTDGTFTVDNIALTNTRVIGRQPVATVKEVVITADFKSVVTKKIHEGIFGINAQHWDADLLSEKCAEYVKAVGHRVIRFPGGLSADEYHWKEMLEAKDHNVDIDEFLDYCDRTGCEPMLTVNFGTGTAAEAASLVHYVNRKRKKNVRYWEVGNELYGSWHNNHCSAESYGKRAAEFIRAMKKEDPSIRVTVVWELESPWNRTVFDYTRDLADGVNVHNYPQESGEENDLALLASPQALEGIVDRLRQQLSMYGTKGKNYRVWLTEWNSVDFNPGPQTLGMVNALFVADYLAMLAKVNIDQASYWNIHNSMFTEGGDYGYLSRSDIPEGPNIPRPSYWAFRLAARALRGTMVKCGSNDNMVTAYCSRGSGGGKNILIVNKYPATSAAVIFNVPECSGKFRELQLTADSGPDGYTTKEIRLEQDGICTLPPQSITVIASE